MRGGNDPKVWRRTTWAKENQYHNHSNQPLKQSKRATPAGKARGKETQWMREPNGLTPPLQTGACEREKKEAHGTAPRTTGEGRQATRRGGEPARATVVADREPRTREERGGWEAGERRTAKETETTGAAWSTAAGAPTQRRGEREREKSRKAIERNRSQKRMSQSKKKKNGR